MALPPRTSTWGAPSGLGRTVTTGLLPVGGAGMAETTVGSAVLDGSGGADGEGGGTTTQQVNAEIVGERWKEG